MTNFTSLFFRSKHIPYTSFQYDVDMLLNFDPTAARKGLALAETILDGILEEAKKDIYE